MSSPALRFIASSPRGLSDLLARELLSFGAQDVRERATGVSFTGSLEVAYRTCLWSRLANRVFLEILGFTAQSADEFYAAVRAIDWSVHIGSGRTLACDFTGKHPSITHTHFGALKLKDAVVDQLREKTGDRPDIELDHPDIRIHAHANGTQISLSLDLSGESLHRRGYRGAGGEAPLKENVAAGVLMRSGWGEMAANGAAFLDPMCGSGTFVIEAAWIAADIAPGLWRDYFGFLGWKGHDAAAWKRLREEARVRNKLDAVKRLVIRGNDRDPYAIRNARANAARAGVGEWVRFDIKSLSEAQPPTRPVPTALSPSALADEAARDPVKWTGAAAKGEHLARQPLLGTTLASQGTGASVGSEVAAGAAARNGAGMGGDVGDVAGERVIEGGESTDATSPNISAPPVGFVCTNPPYGVRLEDRDGARAVHRELGQVLRERFVGWHAAILTGAPEFGMEMGIRAHRTHTLWNGAIECRLLRMKVEADSFRDVERTPGPKIDLSLRESPGAQMFGNRLTKNIRQLRRWTESSNISCYRMYDADMPEYAFAIDSYRVENPQEQWLYIQEYAAPATIDPESVRRRRAEAVSMLPEVTGVPAERIRLRTRRKTNRGDQYSKVGESRTFHEVQEDGLRLLVNFDDYLDTGLFLDHRITRGRLREAAKGRHFLNLFAYTCTATVHAAAGGARTTTSIDMSRTYLEWAERNLALNNFGIDREHELVQADCLEWLDAATQHDDRYGLIFLDPPTFSNSKRMEGVLDTQRDHVKLIEQCMSLLEPEGLLVFSTNAQKFQLDPTLAGRYLVKDISAATLPKDFERNPRIHRCYELRLIS